ncbi:MAG: helix-turn-helix transcriptional regulator [Actinomycetota bacterium]
MIGSMVRSARHRAGFSQRALAARAGVSQSTIARIETGDIDPRARTVRSLLRACDYDLWVDRRLGRGVDRSQIQERLARTPRERLEDLVRAAAAVERIRGRVGRVPR